MKSFLILFVIFTVSCQGNKESSDEFVYVPLQYNNKTKDTLNLFFHRYRVNEVVDSFPVLVRRDFLSDSLLKYSLVYGDEKDLKNNYELNVNTLSLTSSSDEMGFDTLLFVDCFRVKLNKKQINVLKYVPKNPGYDGKFGLFWTIEYGYLARLDYSWGEDDYLVKSNDKYLKFNFRELR